MHKYMSGIILLITSRIRATSLIVFCFNTIDDLVLNESNKPFGGMLIVFEVILDKYFM